MSSFRPLRVLLALGALGLALLASGCGAGESASVSAASLISEAKQSYEEGGEQGAREFLSEHREEAEQLRDAGVEEEAEQEWVEGEAPEAAEAAEEEGEEVEYEEGETVEATGS